MSRAVRFERYGGVEVLEVVELDPPEPGDGQLLVRVRAAGLNPFDSKLRNGTYDGQIPLSFPAAEGNDFSGIVEQVGPDTVGFEIGDRVYGTTPKRGSHAELALAAPGKTIARPPGLSWEIAGSLWTVATTAQAAVAAVAAGAGDVVVVAGASGGVGALASQLAVARGATVIGVTSEPSHDWLRSLGITPIAYGDGLAERLRQAAADAGGSLDALIDTVGRGYVALAVELGIAPERIDTIADFQAASEYGVKTDGASAADSAEVVEEIARQIVSGDIDFPIAATFPLDEVREAYTLLESGHPPGKIVLIP